MNFKTRRQYLLPTKTITGFLYNNNKEFNGPWANITTMLRQWCPIYILNMEVF